MDLKVLISTLFIFAFSFSVIYLIRWFWFFYQARKSGLYPDRKKATLFDVRRLILKKEKFLAIRLYAELYNVNFKEAKKSVEELEKSIQAKNIELD